MNCEDKTLESELSVNNFYAASFLYAQGCRLISVVPHQGHNAQVIFDDEGGTATEAMRAYYRGDKVCGRDLSMRSRS